MKGSLSVWIFFIMLHTWNNNELVNGNKHFQGTYIDGAQKPSGITLQPTLRLQLQLNTGPVSKIVVHISHLHTGKRKKGFTNI